MSEVPLGRRLWRWFVLALIALAAFVVVIVVAETVFDLLAR